MLVGHCRAGLGMGQRSVGRAAEPRSCGDGLWTVAVAETPCRSAIRIMLAGEAALGAEAVSVQLPKLLSRSLIALVVVHMAAMQLLLAGACTRSAWLTHAQLCGCVQGLGTSVVGVGQAGV